ncbi:LysR family transcriptional regulator [Marinigracilibium pacificum]|uniref:LysR family transcriptional regulator n=1 Tax=Marinigracilibium pacificum TaxID=2729599 RepID=A0A848IWV5_9BACT|nr:LysR family transcriptional regulator [Marinigracilibium pacificum]NMM49013.1 LysR family transcriptional regulator [Marinigracilibium pacificum]
MNYTLNQLRVFHKVVETKSITRAAEELFMTQPAVSIQLKNFQDQFDIPLTELKGRRIQVTDFGYEIAAITEKALEQLLNLQYKTKEYKGVVTGKLRIASASTGKYVIPYFLSKFLEDHPGIDLVLDVTNKSQVISELKNKEIEFAVVSVLPEDIDVDIEEEVLIENKLYLVSKSESMVKSKPLIFREPGSATRREMENYFQHKSNRERGRIELTSNEAVKQAVIAGIGSSILPLIGIKNELVDGTLKIIERKGLPIVTTWRIIWLKKKQLTPVAEAYLKFLREEKNKILEESFSWYLKN